MRYFSRKIKQTDGGNYTPSYYDKRIVDDIQEDKYESEKRLARCESDVYEEFRKGHDDKGFEIEEIDGDIVEWIKYNTTCEEVDKNKFLIRDGDEAEGLEPVYLEITLVDRAVSELEDMGIL